MKINHPPGVSRFVALDAHKHYVVVGAVDKAQDVVLKHVRVDITRLPEWVKSHLFATDQVVIESTSNAWHLHDLIRPHVAEVVIANPMKIQLIAQTRVKTDARDTLNLAMLLAAGLIPTVWVPTLAVRDLRGLVAHRDRLIRARTQARNRLHAVLHRHAIELPAGEPFNGQNRAWWEALALSPVERLRIRHDFALLDELRPRIVEADVALEHLSTHLQHRDVVTRLVQLPGIGLTTAMSVLAAVGDIARFQSSKQLTSYAGLGAGVHSSGQTHRTGRITKQGRRDLRRVLIESAWSAVENSPFWKQRFDKLARAKHPNIAIVAIARKLLVLIWQVWSKQATDLNADESFVARKMLAWAEQLDGEGRAGLTTGAFIRQRLTLLGLGHSMKAVSRGPTRFVPMPEPTT